MYGYLGSFFLCDLCSYQGLSLSSVGEYKRAEESHMKALKFDHDFLEAWTHLTQVLCNTFSNLYHPLLIWVPWFFKWGIIMHDQVLILNSQIFVTVSIIFDFGCL